MNRSHRAYLSAIALAAVALTPAQAYAVAPPRVVAMAELAARPIEVAISTKQLTLIHFETGEVSMVAVGDPAIVSVIVKGPDVLLKALTSSGSTNAFIWQGGRYTQWTLIVRQNSKDARLIIVKDSIPGTSNGASSGDDARQENGEQVATVQPSAPATSEPPAKGAIAGSAPTALAPAQQPSAAPAPEKPTNAKSVTGDACGKPMTLDQFLKALNGQQRELFGMFLTEPTLTRLQALVRELSLQQRCDLLGLVPISTPSNQAADFPGSTGAESGQSTTDAQNNGQAPPQAALIRKAPEAQGPPPGKVAQPDSFVPAAVALTVIPEAVDGQLFLYYTLENQSEATLLTDILRLRIFDHHGNRIAFKINRASQGGYLGRLVGDGVEYGVIAIDTSEKMLVLEWKLIKLGSGAQQLMRTEVQVPEKTIDLVAP